MPERERFKNFTGRMTSWEVNELDALYPDTPDRPYAFSNRALASSIIPTSYPQTLVLLRAIAISSKDRGRFRSVSMLSISKIGSPPLEARFPWCSLDINLPSASRDFLPYGFAAVQNWL